MGAVPADVRPSAVAAEEMPQTRFSRRGALLFGLFVASYLAFLYFVLPRLLGLRDTWSQIQHGNGWWLGLEACSFVGYVICTETCSSAALPDRPRRLPSDHVFGAGGDPPVRIRGRPRS